VVPIPLFKNWRND